VKKGLAYTPSPLRTEVPPVPTGDFKAIHGVFLIIAFGAIVWIVLWLVRFAARKISGLDSPVPESEYDFKRLIKERIHSKENLFLHSLTYHDVIRVRTLVEGKWREEFNLKLVDASDHDELEKIGKSHSQPVWLDGVVFSPFDPADVVGKLKQIVRLLRIPGLQVIVSTTGMPLEEIRQINGEGDHPGSKELPALAEEVLQHMEIVPVPIEKTKENYNFRELLRNCTRMEKFVLFDFAGDLLVNFNNRETVEGLWKRGLLVYDGMFNFISPSLRNYILANTSPQEANVLATSLRINDKWMGFEMPSFFLVLGGMTFLAFQPNLFQHVEHFVALLAGVAVLIPRVTGVIDTIRSITPKPKNR
jgi:hypothetical protein